MVKDGENGLQTMTLKFFSFNAENSQITPCDAPRHPKDPICLFQVGV